MHVRAQDTQSILPAGGAVAGELSRGRQGQEPHAGKPEPLAVRQGRGLASGAQGRGARRAGALDMSNVCFVGSAPPITATKVRVVVDKLIWGKGPTVMEKV